MIAGYIRFSAALVAVVTLAFTIMALATKARAEESANADAVMKVGSRCEAAISAAEEEIHAPKNLMQAIARVESGRWMEETNRNVPWPWAVMAEGKGRHYASRDDAVAAVRQLQAKGVRNIDVGCMQINLQYHGKAFTSLEEAFNPINNVAYAAVFLSDLREKNGSWTQAVKFYHSRDRQKYTDYRRKVYETWSQIRREEYRKRLAASEERNRQRKLADNTDKVDAKSGAEKYNYLGLAAWPPTSVSAQRQAEMSARAIVMSSN